MRRPFSLAILALGGILIATGQNATAADVVRRAPAPVYKAPPPVYAPTYNWSGIYLGGHLGYSWSGESATFTGIGLGGSLDPKGFLAGGQIGANWQVGALVFGIEGDLSWTNASGSTTIAGTLVNADHNWYGTATGRLGYAWNNWLLYGKGGAAWMNADYSTPAGSIKATRNGWIVGGGIEYGLAPNWSAKIEYDYLDLGTDVLMVPPSTKVDTQVHTLKMGLNYRFNWTGPAGR
jgi:outer membrane immunogenic protein